MQRPLVLWATTTAGMALAVVGCALDAATEQTTAALVYGDDNRHELFEYDGATWIGRTTSSVVALGWADEVDAGAVHSPSAREAAGLCSTERFGEQPSFAICTGVALAPDLILTAAHCLRVAPLDQLVTLRGFAYAVPDELAPTLDARTITAVVAVDDGLDYAWLRLGSGTPLSPAEVDLRSPVAAAPVVSVNHGLGVPAKVDDGGRVFPRDDQTFWTTIDSFGGASGGPVYDDSGQLRGILTAGSPDFTVSADGCLATRHDPDDQASANELALRIGVALDGLCAADPTAEPCPRPGNGCAAAGPVAPTTPASLAVMSVAAVLALRRRSSARTGISEPALGPKRLPRATRRRWAGHGPCKRDVAGAKVPYLPVPWTVSPSRRFICPDVPLLATAASRLPGVVIQWRVHGPEPWCRRHRRLDGKQHRGHRRSGGHRRIAWLPRDGGPGR
jgi:hypothetical protein